MVQRATDNLEAYNLYLKGRHYFGRFWGAALTKSLKSFTEALTVEPSYVRAQAGMALVQAMRAVLDFLPPHDVMPEAKEEALRVLATDQTVADAHLALAFVRHWYEWDWIGAAQAYRRALDLNPVDSHARCLYGLLLAHLGQGDAAIAQSRRAVEGDPLAVFSQHSVSFALIMARQFDAAISEAQTGLELKPTYAFYFWDLGMAWAGLGRYDEAVEAFRQATVLTPGDAIPQGYLGWALGLAGRRQEALAILADLERRRSQEYVGGVLLAHVNVGLGDHDQAVAWLEQAADERDGKMTTLNAWFIVDPLRSDPRFRALLRRMNFPETVASG